MRVPNINATRLGLAVLAALTLLCAGATNAEPDGKRFDLVIVGGRVMDPETGTDRILNVGVKNGRIEVLSPRQLFGAKVVDARGLVVAPGFIDLHTHVSTTQGYDLHARDGVTTALELEGGAYPIATFYSARAGRARINYGASVGVQDIRVKIKTGIEGGGRLPSDEILARKSDWAEAAFTPQERQQQREMLAKGLADGGLGVGLLYEYLPGLTRDEALELFGVAAKSRAPVFVHARAAEQSDPDHLLGPLQEMIADSAATGAPLHYCHIGSKGQGPVFRLEADRDPS